MLDCLKAGVIVRTMGLISSVVKKLIRKDKRICFSRQDMYDLWHKLKEDFKLII